MLSMSEASRRERSDATAAADATGAAPATVDDTPDVFLSYCAQGRQFVLRLASALQAGDWRVWVDEDDIPPAAEWRDELAAGIRAAHTFVFVLSPDSVASDYCRWELEQAVALGKRLIPVVFRPVDEAPKELAARQYIFMREQDDFGQALETLVAALRTDLEWVQRAPPMVDGRAAVGRATPRPQSARARPGSKVGRGLARTASGTDGAAANAASDRVPLASREWERRRVQIMVCAVTAALAVAIALGVVALLQRNDARHQAAIARSRELATVAASQLAVDPERSLLLAREAVRAQATAEADNALRQAVFSSRARATVPLGAQRVGGLINAVAFSPDGKHVAAAQENGTVSVVSSTARRGDRATVLPLAPRKPDDVCSMSVSAAGHVALAFSPNGRFVAAVNKTDWIHVWRWQSREKPVTSTFCLGRTTAPELSDLLTILSANRTPAALTFAGDDVVAVAQADGHVLRWSWATAAKPVLQGHPRQGLLTAAFSEEGQDIALAEPAGITMLANGGQRRPVSFLDTPCTRWPSVPMEARSSVGTAAGS